MVSVCTKYSMRDIIRDVISHCACTNLQWGSSRCKL